MHCIFVYLTWLTEKETISDIFLFSFILQVVHGSGYFELQILEIQNYRGELSNGDCCGGVPRSDSSLLCPRECNTYFSVCLKEYQSNVTSTPCSFGNTSSPVLGRNSFTLTDPDKANATMKLPFTFRWTVSNHAFCSFIWGGVEEKGQK